MEKQSKIKTSEELKNCSINKSLKDEFKINYINEDENFNDDYEKVLETDIQKNCDLNVYVNKLVIEEKKDEDLIKLEKQEIIDFKNYQIQKLKAYINSLETEKEDLIENYRNTTNNLLDRIKDLETKSTGKRPETAFIVDKMISKNREKVGSNKVQVYSLDKQIEYEYEEKFDGIKAIK